jgi:hypothetical protein
LVKVARESDDLAWHALQELLRASSDAFVPLADPLAIDFGAHRWLSSEREEAYSDWLEWVLKQIGNAGQILRLLGMQDEDLVRECASEKPDIKREFPVKGGRLDLLITFGNRLLVIVEIKTKLFDEDEVLSQLGRYRKWIQGQHQYEQSHSYFLAVDPGDFSSQEQFVPLHWRELALRMREQARAWTRAQNGSDIVRAAMIVAFCGAVEQNLLGLSGKRVVFRNRVSVEYLKEWSEKSEE